MRCHIYCDGACRFNPGPMSIGASIRNDLGQEFHVISELLPYEGTNNIAEYEALLAALRHVLEAGYDEVVVHSDSQLVINHINGDYRCQRPELIARLNALRGLIKDLRHFTAHYLPGVNNGTKNRAHELAQAAFKTPEGKAMLAKRSQRPTYTP